MSDQKQIDLAKLQSDLARRREDGFNFLRGILRYDETQLRHCGYKTVEQAVVGTVRNVLKDCDKLTAAFIKKYPD